MTHWVVLSTIIFFFGFGTAPAPSGHEHENEQPSALNVDLWDYCDPASFNAVLGDGACVRDTSTGAITFGGFNAELGLEKSVGAWRFVPNSTRNDEGISFTLRSMGGETHTFTRVKKFGGGFVAPLNAASGNPNPAPECAQTVDGKLVPQPPSADNIFVPAGAVVPGPQVEEDDDAKFQCCIHPWMRLTVHASHKHEDRH